MQTRELQTRDSSLQIMFDYTVTTVMSRDGRQKKNGNNESSDL